MRERESNIAIGPLRVRVGTGIGATRPAVDFVSTVRGVTRRSVRWENGRHTVETHIAGDP